MAAFASPSSLISISRVLSPLSSPNGSLLFVGPTKPPPTVAFSGRNKRSGGKVTSSSSHSSKVKKRQSEKGGEKDEIDEDAFEALFSQLEEDLKNDLSIDDDKDEITEEDLAKLEQELEEALGDVDLDELAGGVELDELPGDAEESDDEEERPPKLKTWQAKRLAYALKVGRRKTSIKCLAAELGLDRAFVLELLRDPPPQLLLMSASLPDKVSKPTPEVEIKDKLSQTTSDLEDIKLVDSPTDIVAENEPELQKLQEPVHVKQTRWVMQKRLKKVQVETLERVYSRTKRPTNAMISSIVHVTNLPSKRVVKWFEDKRLHDGVPDHREPFRRSDPKLL